jgi:hypothetical protein
VVGGQDDHGVLGGLQRLDPPGHGRQVDAGVGEERGLADQHLAATHDGADPGAGDRGEVLHLWNLNR